MVPAYNSPYFFKPLFGVSTLKRWIILFNVVLKDCSRSTAYAVQTEYANHQKVLCSKGKVLNVKARSIKKAFRMSIKKLNESKSTEAMSKWLPVLHLLVLTGLPLLGLFVPQGIATTKREEAAMESQFLREPK